MEHEALIKPLGEITYITKLAGFEYTKHFDYKVGGEIIALRSLNIKNGKLDLTEVHTIPKSVSDALPRSQLMSNDVVLGYVGSKLGNLAKIEHNNKFHLAPNVAVIRPSENIDSDYLLQYMQAPYFQSRLWAFASSTGQPALSMTNIRKLPVVLFSVEEQRKIAKILSTWDKAISTTERLIDNSKQQKKALMQQLLSGKKRLLDDSGKPFEGEWKTLTIGNLGEIYSGGTPSTSTKEYWDGGIDWVTPTDITKQNSVYIHSSKRKITSEGVKSSSAKLVPKGSLLVCTRATIGEMAITAHEMCTNQGFKNIVPNNKSNIEFLFYLLAFEKHKLVSKASGSTFLELSKSAFESINFDMPKVDEQQKIAAVLTNADKEIELLAQQLADLKQEKKALMQKLLTGKRRVLI